MGLHLQLTDKHTRQSGVIYFSISTDSDKYPLRITRLWSERGKIKLFAIMATCEDLCWLLCKGTIHEGIPPAGNLPQV